MLPCNDFLAEAFKCFCIKHFSYVSSLQRLASNSIKSLGHLLQLMNEIMYVM